MALLLQTPIAADLLLLVQGSCAELTPTQFHEVLRHFSPTNLNEHIQLRACQISDEILRALFKDRMRRIVFLRIAPVDGGNFYATDDALVDLCLQPDVQIVVRRHFVRNGTFVKDLFKRLVEAAFHAQCSVRTEPLQIEVSPLRFNNEDLQDFTQHLSYRHRGHRCPMRIYDFPGDQH